MPLRLSPGRPGRLHARLLFFVALAFSVARASAGCGDTVQSIVSEWSAAPSNVPSSGSVDGPLLGNGGLGMVLGGPTAAGPSGHAGSLTLYAGLTSFWASAIDGFSHCGYGDGGVKQPGGLTFSFANKTALAFRARQWVSEARVEASVSDGETTLHISAFVSANHDLSLVTLRVDAPAPVAVTSTLWTVDGCGLPFQVGEPLQGVIHAQRMSALPYQAVRKGVAVTTADLMARPLTAPFSAVAAHGTAVSGDVLLTPGTPVTVAFAATDGGTDHAAGLISQAMEAGGPGRIADGHLAWWRQYWARSCVAFPALHDLERYWYGSQYVLAISARAGRTPPGLWGSFITTDGPGWQGDYTLNYNAQSPYFGTLSSNHPEISAAQFRPYLDFVPKGRRMAEEYYGCEGIVFPGHIGPAGMISTDVQTMGQLSNAAFAAVNFVWHYEFTRDGAFLRDEAYPFVKEVALFWRCWLERSDEGPGASYRYVDRNDCVNELCDASQGRAAHNPIISLSFIRFVLGAAARWSKALGLDDALRADWVEIVTHLSDYPTADVTLAGAGGGDEKITVFAPSEGEKPQPPGSNPFEVYPMHPVSDVNLSSDQKLIDTGRNTLRRLQSWKSGNAFPLIFTSAVRIDYNSTEVLANFLSNIRDSLGANLYYAEGGGGIEGAGATLALNEMLLQSAEGFARFFPALDPSARPASFQHLRTISGFLVSASISKNGTVHDVVVEPAPDVAPDCLGGCDVFEFLNPWPGHSAPAVVVEGASREAEARSTGGDRYQIVLRAGERAKITPGDGTRPEGGLRGVPDPAVGGTPEAPADVRRGAVWI